MTSWIIPTRTMHARLSPVRHEFTYDGYIYALDLDELTDISRELPFFGHNTAALTGLYDQDYLDWEDGPIKPRLRRKLEELGYRTPFEQVILITQPRYLGVKVFNPVSFYLCYTLEGRLCYTVAEINNTFWERALYVFEADQGGESHRGTAKAHRMRHRSRTQKRFHVSPFFTNEYDYAVEVADIRETLDIRINLEQNGITAFVSRFWGRPTMLSKTTHLRTLATAPLSPLLTMPRILWQGLKLWAQHRLPVVKRPPPPHETTLRAEPYSWLDMLSRSTVRGALQRMKRGALTLVYPDGRAERFGPPDAQTHATIRINSYDFFRKIILGGGVGLGEAYVDGLWESPDPAAALSVILNDWDALDERKLNLFKLSRVVEWVRHLRSGNTMTNAKKNISAHYDLSNELFSLFLDPTMTYSSAIYPHSASSLEDAQREKISRLIEKTRVRAGDHLLEIGSGWGALALTAAARTRCAVTSITLSRKQLALARQRALDAGLSERVRFELCDYRTVQGRYDAIVSVEMLEAVGKEYLGTFFKRCDQLLNEHGIAVLQVITYPETHYRQYCRRADWIQKHIFPGSHIPSLQAIIDAASQNSSLIVEHIENIAPHYARTLQEWRARFMTRLDEVRALGYDERFIRSWEYYLASCEAEFSTRWLGVAQIVLTRPNNPRLVGDDVNNKGTSGVKVEEGIPSVIIH